MPDGTGTSAPAPTINPIALGRARSSFGSYASGGGGSLGGSVRDYVHAHRGAQNATQATRAGRTSTKSLGGFLSGVAQRGVTQTLRDVGLSDVIGSSPITVVSAILNLITPPGDTLDDAIARRAESDTMGELYRRFDLEDGIENFDRMTEADVKDTLILSVSNHIFQRFVHTVEKGLQDGNVRPDQAEMAEHDAKEYIRGKVLVDFGDRDVIHMDWNGTEATGLIENIFTQAHIILEEATS
ncbi:MAG: hypothetical protein K8J31_15880 [Anaerolineae bacterium]|nr:hypothetical protein [Anaerolineae bacterium]